MLVNQVPRPMVGQMGRLCPALPSTFKYLAGTLSFVGSDTQTVSFTTPGAFCPYKMFIITTGPITDILVSGIKAGIEEQIISGLIPGDLFGIFNDCCPVACLKCLCSPGIEYQVTLTETGGMASDVTVILVGSYLDACPPHSYVLPDVPGCPYPGSDKLLGFDISLGPAAETDTLSLTTPGKFCPRQMFVMANGSEGVFSFEGIRSGLKDQIISGTLPATLFTTANECCVLACFDCLCRPGYPLFLDIHTTGGGEGPATLRGALIGSYEDFCP